MKKYIFILVIVSISFQGYGEEVSRIIAKVNNEVITSRDLDEYCRKVSYRLSGEEGKSICADEQTKKEALMGLIDDTLILEEARRENIIVPSSWINSKLDEVIASFPSWKEFENSLIEKGLSVTLLKKKIKEQYLVREVMDKNVRSLVRVSPSEISQFYNSHLEDFVSPEQYSLWIVKSDDRAFLEKVAKKLIEEGIEEAKKEHGEVLINIESSKEQLLEGIASALEGIEKGQYLIKNIDDTNYFIYFEEIIPSKKVPLEEVKEKIYNYIRDMKFKIKFTEWVKELRKEAIIKIYWQ